MPELPDVELYLHVLRARLVGARLLRTRVLGLAVLKSVTPPLAAFEGQPVVALSRLGKRLVFTFPDERHLVLHLMIAGRLRWGAPGSRAPGRIGLATFEFEAGALHLTEASTKKRANLHAVAGDEALRAHDPGGLEPLDCDLQGFTTALRRERHTLKRALTDPTIFAGIGNAYSDELLHAAGLSPFRRTDQLDEAQLCALFEATRATLAGWRDRLIAETGAAFPEKVTAFREGMAVHGRFGLPCPRCGTKVQRIVWSEHEANYCPTCQTEGRLLADRGLSRLLREDFPKSLEALEARKAALRGEGAGNSPAASADGTLPGCASPPPPSPPRSSVSSPPRPRPPRRRS